MTYESRKPHRTSAREVVAVFFLLAAGSRAAAQPIDFNSPDAWALKYFSAITTFTAIGPPVFRQPGAIDGLFNVRALVRFHLR